MIFSCWLTLVSAMQAQPAISVWIDTDPSVARGGHEVDDGFALLQAFRSPEFNIVGVSVVFGNASLKEALPIGQRLMRDFGPRNLVVYSGAASAKDLGRETAASRALAAALVRRRFTILALGPATNIATVLQRHPELASRIERIVAVAGRRPQQRFVTGTAARPFRDFNFELDPQAFQVLLDSGVPLVLAPWEISSKVWITADDLGEITSADASLHWVAAAAQDWLKLWKHDFAVDGFNPFDTLAVGYVLSPSSFTCQSLPVAIQTLPDDTLPAGSSPVPLKPYLVADPNARSGRSALYCSQAPAGFRRELMNRLANQKARPAANPRSRDF